MRGSRGVVRSSALAVACAAAVTVAVGCGGGSPPRITSFTASPASLPRGGGDVVFHWTAKNASRFDLEPLVGAVTGTSASVVVTTSATFTLTAKNPLGGAHAQTTVTVGAPISVSGFVVDPIFGNEPNLSVFVLGQDQVLPALTASDGSFSLDGVVPPYDLVVASVVAPAAVVFRGVTRPDPLVTLPTFPSILPRPLPPQKTATAAGSLSGGTFPLTATQFGVGQSFGPHVAPTAASVDAATGNFSCFSAWIGHAAVDQTCAFLIGSQSAPGADPDYLLGSRTETLTSGDAKTGESIALSSVTTAHATGSVSGLDGPVGPPTAFLRLGPGGAFTIPPAGMVPDPLLTSTNTTYAWGVPLLPQGAPYALVTESGPTGAVLESFRLSGGARDLTVPLPPTIELPLPGAQIDGSTRFALDMPPGTVSIDYLTIGPGTLWVISAEPQWTLDEIGAGELGLLPQTTPVTANWVPLAAGIFGSVDEALDPAGADGDVLFGVGAGRTFTVVP